MLDGDGILLPRGFHLLRNVSLELDDWKLLEHPQIFHRTFVDLTSIRDEGKRQDGNREDDNQGMGSTRRVHQFIQL
jgi:hypothetical protein